MLKGRLTSCLAGAAALAALPLAANGQSGGMADLHDQVRVGNKICFSDHFHYGSSGGQPSRKAAEREAIASWADFVDFEYGSAWSSYNLAASKGMSCSSSGGSWSCSLEARPCRRR